MCSPPSQRLSRCFGPAFTRSPYFIDEPGMRLELRGATGSRSIVGSTELSGKYHSRIATQNAAASCGDLWQRCRPFDRLRILRNRRLTCAGSVYAQPQHQTSDPQIAVTNEPKIFWSIFFQSIQYFTGNHSASPPRFLPARPVTLRSEKAARG
jgi:hypothetical protein